MPGAAPLPFERGPLYQEQAAIVTSEFVVETSTRGKEGPHVLPTMLFMDTWKGPLLSSLWIAN
jgi:hypothetical protein